METEQTEKCEAVFVYVQFNLFMLMLHFQMYQTLRWPCHCRKFLDWLWGNPTRPWIGIHVFPQQPMADFKLLIWLVNNTLKSRPVNDVVTEPLIDPLCCGGNFITFIESDKIPSKIILKISQNIHLLSKLLEKYLVMKENNYCVPCIPRSLSKIKTMF